MARVLGFMVCVVCIAGVVGESPASANAVCSYSASSRIVQVSLVEDRGTIVRSGRAINFNGAPCGAATVDNTVRIDVTGSFSHNSATIDLSGGGFSTPAGNIPIDVRLGRFADSLDIVGSAGADSIRVGTAGINLDAASTASVDVTITNVQRLSIEAGLGTDTVSADGGAGTGDPYPSNVKLDGGGGNDSITGGLGNDDLIGGPGVDNLNGGPGTDTADYGDDQGPISADLTTGVATDGGGHMDTLESIENVRGSFFDGGAITGDDGPNRLTGDGPIYGAGGDDVLESYGPAPRGSYDGGDGTDTLLCNGDGDLFAHIKGGQASCGQLESIDNIENITGFTTCTGGFGCRVQLTGNDGANVLQVSVRCNCQAKLSGEGGDDVLIGASLAPKHDPSVFDFLQGGSGNDVLRGLRGDDLLRGDSGADTIFGGGNADTIKGGPGRDRLFGNHGRDTLRGGRGADALRGGQGIDTCEGGRGRDTLRTCERGTA